MIGIFDSGVGGLTALYELRRLCPEVDICYLADSANAPYGEKDEGTLIRLVKDDIARLVQYGADSILIACCTACTVYGLIGEENMRISQPIIEPAAEAAASNTRSGRIGVISTAATAKSGVFVKKIKDILPGAEVISLAAGELVTLVERGARDGALESSQRRVIEKALTPLFGSGIDTLVLGCTHFTHVKGESENILGVATVSPSIEGARVMAERISRTGEGKTIFISGGLPLRG